MYGTTPLHTMQPTHTEAQNHCLPRRQVRAMLKERLTATLLQDRKRMRRLFLKYDENNRGYLKPAQLHRLLCDLGCDITLGEVLRSYGKRLVLIVTE